MSELTQQQKAQQQAAIDALRAKRKGSSKRPLLVPAILALSAAAAFVAIRPASETPEQRAARIEQQRIDEERAVFERDAPGGYAKALTAMQSLSQRWADATRLASVSPRASLPGTIATMQQIVRELTAVDLPPCLANAREIAVRSASTHVDAYLLFMAVSKDEATIAAKLTVADSLWRQHEQAMDACQAPKPGSKIEALTGEAR